MCVMRVTVYSCVCVCVCVSAYLCTHTTHTHACVQWVCVCMCIRVPVGENNNKNNKTKPKKHPTNFWGGNLYTYTCRKQSTPVSVAQSSLCQQRSQSQFTITLKRNQDPWRKLATANNKPIYITITFSLFFWCCFAVKNDHLQRSYGCSTLFCFVLLCCQEWSFAKKLHTWRYHASIELVLTTMNDFSSCLINTPANMPDPIRKRFGYS